MQALSTPWPAPRADDGAPRGDVIVGDLLEVRLLGRFAVRADAGAVAPTAWRTTKTRDLFRLLAITPGKVVPVDAILDALWPEAPPDRGRASLRTAASQIRRVVGEAHVAREASGMLLTGAWVDARAFETAAETAERALRRGEAAIGVSAAWDALNLYTGDLCDDAPYAEWVAPERDRLHGLLRTVLLDACDAACELGWLRDAAELGHRALQLEPSSERAHRGLMRTYWRLGETEQAVGLYDQCRRVLAEELGVDPGPETRAVHLELLRSPPVEVAQPALVGRGAIVRRLRESAEDVAQRRRALGIVLSGEPGSGRSRVVQEALAAWGDRRIELLAAPGEVLRAEDLVQQIADHVGCPAPRSDALADILGPDPVALVLEGAEHLDVDALDLVDDLVGRRTLPLLVLVTASDDACAVQQRLTSGWERYVLPPLTADEAQSLLHSVLHAPPAPRLTAELHEASAGNPAALVATGRRLLATGQLVMTVQGMARVERARGQGPALVDQRLTQARASTSDLGCRALDLLVVLDRPVTAGELSRLLDVAAPTLRAALDPLVDHLVLRTVAEGYVVQDALVREAAYRWLRPSTRRRLHEAVAGLAVLPPDVRAQQWLLAGEPALACAAALEAADAAVLRGDHAAVREQLLLVRSHAERNDIDPGERIVLMERMADAAAKLGRAFEARSLLDEAIALARTDAPASLARLHIALGRLAGTQADALLAYVTAPVPTAGTPDQRRIGLAVAAATTGRMPDVATRLLVRAVQEADAAADLGAQVKARVLLSRATAQQRELEASTTAARAALALAEASGDGRLFVQAGHAVVQPAVFLGDALTQLPLLQRLRSRSLVQRDPVTVLDVGITLALALHELGSPAFHTVWQDLDDLRGLGRTRLHRLVAALVHLERGRPGVAERLLQPQPGHLEAVVADQATQVLHSRLLSAAGDTGAAVAALCGVVGDTGHRGVRLLLPEAGARLAELLAPHDPRAAEVELARALSGARGKLHPREHVCLFRARAALLLSSGQADAAHAVLVAAGLTARRAGLVFQEAEVHDLRARILDTTAPERATEARQTAAELRRAASDRSAAVDVDVDVEQESTG